MTKRNIYPFSCPDLQKEKQYRNEQKLWLKVKKVQEQHEEIIIELKGRAVKFYKSSITFLGKVNLQLKNKQKSTAATH